jgi:hypothetical protein
MEKPINDSQKENQNEDEGIKPRQSIIDRPVGGQNLDEAPIGGKTNNNMFLENEGGKDMADTLEGRLKSGDAKVRIQAYIDLIEWSDSEYTPAIFAKGLHLTIKEKDPNVIDKILTAIESLMEKHPTEFATIDMKKFLPNFAEFLLNNVKGPSKDHSSTFIVKLWESNSNKNELLERFKEMITTVKVKLQEKALVMIFEIVKAGKIEELQLLKPLYPELEKLIVSRTAGIKTQAFEIYKETFLWIGEGIKPFITGFKEAQAKEFETYMKSIDPKDMKTLKKDGEKGGKKLDVYNMFTEAELPKKYNEDQFADDVMEKTKWSERKKLLDELNEILEKTPKISQKTNCFIYMNLARRIFIEPNVAVQVSIIKTLGLFASGMRKGFAMVAKTMFPILLAKLKDKNRSICDEILNSLERFFFCMTFEDSYQEIEESLADKNPEKKKNVLNLLFVMNDKLELIKTAPNSIKITKLVVKLIDENDQVIREKASELIARQLDAFEEKINPILKDLNSQKMAKIMKYRQKMASIPIEIQPAQSIPSSTQGVSKTDGEAGDSKTGGKGRNFYDKSQMIAKIREEMFSNRIVKITEVRNFSQYLFKNLLGLTELTKEFKEITASQATEIYLLIDEIVQKVDKQVLIEDSRKIIAQFYMEQLLGKSSEELNQSLDRYLNCSSKVVNSKIFLQDLLNVLTKKIIKLNKELLTVVLKLYEDEVQANTKLANFPHNLFVEFLKIYFSVPNIHVSMKLPLIQTMRIVSTKFGEKATNDFPQVLFKELSTQNIDLQKMFEKTYEKLISGDPEKNRQAISDLNSCDDHSKMSYFWSKPEFLTYLNKQLNYEGEDNQFGSICQIVSNYLLIKAESPIDFKIKYYLSIFQTILAIHYGNGSNFKKGETDKIVNQTVELIGAPKILNEMISDSSLAMNKFQILSFYFEFAFAIEPNLKIINYLSNIIEQKNGINSDVQPLLELVLLLIKNTNNDEVIVKGSENRYIRDVWQKREIDLLLNENLVYGSKLFEDQTTYNMIKNFLVSNLKMEDSDFYSYQIEGLKIGNEETPLKMKLAYFYLRSIENIRKNCLFILGEVCSLKIHQLNREEILIALKIVFNVLRNLVYMQNNESFKKGRDFFIEYINRTESEQEMPGLFNFNSNEHTFYIQILKRQEIRYCGREEENEQEYYEKEVDVSYNRGPYQAQNERGHQKNQVKNKTNHLKIDEPYAWGTQQRLGDSPVNNRSVKKKVQNANLEAQRRAQIEAHQREQMSKPVNRNNDYSEVYSNDVSYIMTGTSLEKNDLLMYHFENMKSFDLDRSEEARRYFEDLCKSSSPTSHQFLCNFANEIVNVFVGCIENIFLEGINYNLDRPTYEIIFTPLQMLFTVEGFLCALRSEVLNFLVGQILIRLVTANEEKQLNAQENDEEKLILSDFMIKFWNSLMLKIIEKAEPNFLINSLFSTVMEIHMIKDKTIQTALFNLAMRCLSKISKNLKKIIPSINPNNIFVLVHNYIQQFGIQNSESVGSKAMKSLINELVSNFDFQEIWMHYDQCFGDDNEQVIIKWIKIVQNKMVENRMIEIIQQCEARGTNQAVLELVDFYTNLKDIVPELQMHKYSDYFQDPGFFEKVMVEIPPDIDPKAFSKNGNQKNASSKTGGNQGIQVQKNNRGTNQKKSADKFKKVNNDHFLDKSELSNNSDVSELREVNHRRKNNW